MKSWGSWFCVLIFFIRVEIYRSAGQVFDFYNKGPLSPLYYARNPHWSSTNVTR